MDKVQILIDALESIAAKQMVESNTVKRWLQVNHEDLAKIVKVDTEIARKALEEFK